MERIKKLLATPIRLKINLPNRLLKSNIPVSDAEFERIKREHQIERDWYGQTPFYDDNAAILAASKVGELVKVVPCGNYLPIMRLRNPKLHDQYPPFLTPMAKQLLDEISAEWRIRMREAKLDDQIQLALTSVVRGKEYQMKLVESGKLALPDGPHLRGEAFDIDGCGYYFDGNPVNPRQQEQKEEWRSAFKKLDAEQATPEILDYKQYDPKVHQLLQDILDEMMVQNKLHYLHEFPNTTNTVFHIARNPKYRPE